MEKQFIIIKQWGKKRSVVDFISNYKKYCKQNILVDNEQLIFYDELGLILN